MTETEWNECGVYKMLNFVKGDRKKRLFSCACVRQNWHLLTDDRSKQAVIISEKYADGLASKEKLDEARRAAWYDYAAAAAAAAYAADENIDITVHWVTSAAWSVAASSASSAAAAKNKQILLLKDIFDPFSKIQKPKINKTIIHFANEIYNNHDQNGFFNSKDLNILADILYDEGYDNDHLRNGNHVRGCQLIDLILGKQ